MTTDPADQTSTSVIRSLELTWIAAYAYVALEWLFFATKPSFLNLLPFSEQLAILFVSPIPWLCVASLAVLGLGVPVFLATRGGSWTKRWADILLACVPGVTIACALFLLIDNFTYTIFGFGVVTSTGFGRLLHTAVFVTLVVACVRFAVRQNGPGGFLDAAPVRCAIALALVGSVAFAGWARVPVVARDAQHPLGGGGPPATKNVLVFAADGLDANRMSAYSAERDTTPFIRSLLPESLIFENHFTNSATTTGSVASLLGGKLPTTTHVIYRPDVLRGADVYQHLPGLLRAHGYESGDFSVRHYADAHDLNMRGGFHYANGRELGDDGAGLPELFTRTFPSTALFVEAMADRIRARLLHVFGLQTMENPFLEVTLPDPNESSDRKRVDELKAFIRRARRPFFAHVHLMASHGWKFPIERQVFSTGEQEWAQWDLDFYDDAILQYDDFVREVVGFLRDEELLDETLLILNTDHGYRWGIGTPLPLVMRFPEGEHSGRSKVNSQRLDIAPTILDYLGISRPAWLQGRSLLSDARSRDDQIYIVDRTSVAFRGDWLEVLSPKPPFYTLGALAVIQCDRLFTLKLPRGRFSSRRIEGHTQPCAPDELPPASTVHSQLIEHLAQAGYDTSTLPAPR